jgi:DNA-binding beta-propeller fold protein YncE
MRIATSIAAWIMPIALSAQTILVVQEGRGKVVVFNAGDASNRASITVGEKPHEIEVAPDGSTAFVSNFGLLEADHKAGTPGTTISVIDVARRSERGRFQLPAGYTAPHGLKLRPPAHRELFTNTEEGREAIVVFDAKSGEVVRTFPLPPGVHNFVFNSDGSALFAFTIRGDVCRIDPDSGKVIARTTTGSPRGLAWTADGRRLIVSGKGEILMLEPVTLTVEKRAGELGVGQIFYPAATSDGRWILAPAVLDGVVLVIDASTLRVSRQVRTGSPLIAAIAPDGKHAWISNVLVPAGLFGPSVKAAPGGVAVLDLDAFTATAIPSIEDANGLAVVAAR